MKTIIHNNFLEFNLIIFPIWIVPIYFFLNNILGNPELIFLIFLMLFGETHFASTYLFYFEKNNHDYIKLNSKLLIKIPLLLVLVYITIGIIDFKSAVVLGAIGSGIHVTRQSIGVLRLYSNNKNIFYEFIVYLSSFCFLFLGFCRFYLLDILQRFNVKIITLNSFISNENNLLYLYILLVLMFCLISLSEKTNIKKKLINVTGVLIYSPYLFVDHIYDAIIIGVGAHWCQYLAINYKVYLYNEKFDFNKICLIIFVCIYSIIMSLIGYKYQFNESINYLILIPLTGQVIHYYVDAFIWRFSDPHIRINVGSKLFA